MKQFLSILFIATLTNAGSFLVTKQCACTEILSLTDCNASKGCAWGTSCQQKTCSAITTQVDCDVKGPCGWTGTACAAFTKCADYTVKISTQCGQKGPCTAAATANTDGTFTCADAVAVTCSTFTTSATCIGKQADNKVCTWANNACAAYDLTTCGGILDQTSCTAMNCKWGTACTIQTCADQKTSVTCTLVRGDPFPSIQVCSWNATTSVCSDLTDANSLTSANCSLTTGYGYRWNTSTNQCEACTGLSSTYEMVLGTVLAMMVLAL